MSDHGLRELERLAATGDPEALERVARARERIEDGLAESQRRAFLLWDAGEIRRRLAETPGAAGLVPERVHLAAFLGDEPAADALGVTPVEIQGGVDEWLTCVSRWGGDSARLAAGIALADAWLPALSPRRALLHRAQAYARRATWLRDWWLRRAIRAVTGQRTSGAFVLYEPGASVLRWGLAVARDGGASENAIRSQLATALLAWTRSRAS